MNQQEVIIEFSEMNGNIAVVCNNAKECLAFAEFLEASNIEDRDGDSYLEECWTDWYKINTEFPVYFTSECEVYTQKSFVIPYYELYNYSDIFNSYEVELL